MKTDQIFSFRIWTPDHGASAGTFGYLFKLEGSAGACRTVIPCGWSRCMAKQSL